MIGAIGIKLNNRNSIRLYPAGGYNDIDWDTEFPSDLGNDYTTYHNKDASTQKPALIIAQGLDGRYILRLIETKRYVLRIVNETNKEIPLPHFQNEGNKFLKVDQDKDSVTFQFINYLGRSRVYFSGSDKTLMFEVVPDKMDYEDDYIRLTEAIADRCSELLLDYTGATSNAYTQSNADKETLLEQFIFLRKFCYKDNLQGLFEAIKRNPDLVLDREDEMKPTGVGVPSKKFFHTPFSYSRGWMNVSGEETGKKVHIPSTIATTRKFDRLDTPANRFVKYALQKFDSICVELIDILQISSQGMQIVCKEEAKAIHESLEYIFRDPFFDQIGNLDIMPQNNQVLQKREGYSQIFVAYLMIDLALQLDWKGKEDLYEGESQNVALLYEYWLFFELYKIVKSIDGCMAIKTKETPFIVKENGIAISLQEGKQSCQSFEIEKLGIKINLYYNRTFSRKKFYISRYEGSYSRKFRPDYTLAVFPLSYTEGKYNGETEAMKNGAVSFIHFDAKYRITDLTDLIGNKEIEADDEDIIEDKANAIVNTYKCGDLLKMHTYNDAIRRTVGSFVLYPGSDSKYETFELFDEILPGVGAYSIKPSTSDQGEKRLRAFITKLIETESANNSRLKRLQYYTKMILDEPSSIIKHEEEKSIKIVTGTDELYVIGYIRGDSEKDYYRFLKNNGLLHKGYEFPFYFYAINGNAVYSHHPDIFKAHYLRFYTNQIYLSESYMLEPVLCEIVSNELVSKDDLVQKLRSIGFNTSREEHFADFYYVLNVRVLDELFSRETLEIAAVNSENGNDTFSPHSPKVVCISRK